MTKPVYDLMVCADGATRAVPVINGVKVDPTLKAVEEAQKEKDKEENPKKRVISIQDRLQGKWKILFQLLKDEQMILLIVVIR